MAKPWQLKSKKDVSHMDNRSKPRRAKTNGIFARIDLPLLVCYILLIIIGWIAVCGASYGFDVE